MIPRLLALWRELAQRATSPRLLSVLLMAGGIAVGTVQWGLGFLAVALIVLAILVGWE